VWQQIKTTRTGNARRRMAFFAPQRRHASVRGKALSSRFLQIQRDREGSARVHRVLLLPSQRPRAMSGRTHAVRRPAASPPAHALLLHVRRVRRLGSSAATAALLVLGREREGGGGAEVLHAGFILSVMKKTGGR
jgi:hypothetical protein